MGFKHFNLKDARVNILSTQPPRNKSIDRRKFFKAIGIGALAFTPVVGSFKKALAAPFELKATGQGFDVLRNGVSVWGFPSPVFDRSAHSVVTEHNNSYFIELSNVRFVGSEQAFDVLVKIYHNDFRWRMLMEIPQFNASQDIDFLQFLDRNEQFESHADIQYTYGNPASKSSLTIKGNVDIAIDRGWNFTFEGAHNIHLDFNGNTYSTNGLLVSSNGRKAQRSFVTAPSKALMLTLPEFKTWDLFIGDYALSNQYSLSSFGQQPDVNLLMWDDKTGNHRQSLFVNSNKGGLQFANNRFDNFNFKLHRFFLVSEILNCDISQTYLAAGIHHEGQWYSNSLGSFLMGSKSDMPDFEALGEANTFSNYRFAPHITSFKPAIENAITLATTYPEPLRLKIVSESSGGPDLLPALVKHHKSPPTLA